MDDLTQIKNQKIQVINNIYVSLEKNDVINKAYSDVIAALNSATSIAEVLAADFTLLTKQYNTLGVQIKYATSGNIAFDPAVYKS